MGQSISQCSLVRKIKEAKQQSEIPPIQVSDCSDSSSKNSVTNTPFDEPNNGRFSHSIDSSDQTVTATAKTISSRGIFKMAYLFWECCVASESKTIKKELNSWMLKEIFATTESDNFDSDLSVDIISIIGALLELLNSLSDKRSTMVKLRTYMEAYQEICKKFEVTTEALLELWCKISNNFIAIYGTLKFPIAVQYALDISALFVISLMWSSSSVSLAFAARDNVDSLLTDMIALGNCESCLDILVHPFGAKYLCRYIESEEWGKFEILDYWRMHYAYERLLPAQRKKIATLESYVMNVYVNDTAEQGLVATGVLTPQFAQRIRQHFEENHTILFSDIFDQIIEWLDVNHLENVTQSFRNLKRNNLHYLLC